MGSTRAITDSSGNVCYDADYYPYGGERDITDSCTQNYKFTGRDSESNLQGSEVQLLSGCTVPRHAK